MNFDTFKKSKEVEKIDKKLFVDPKRKKKYACYLAGKKVVIIGPAPHIVGTEQYDKIESYDVVVRLNTGWMDPFKKNGKLKKDIGYRTDVLYTSMGYRRYAGPFIDIKELRSKIKLRWICMSCPTNRKVSTIEKFNSINKNRISFYIVDPIYFSFLTQKIRMPDAGTMAILDILTYDISELYITGMTFQVISNKRGYYYYSDYYNGVKKRLTRGQRGTGKKRGKHHSLLQLGYIRQKYLEDKRINCDDVLVKLFEL